MGTITLVDPSTNAARVFDEDSDAPAVAEALARGWTAETDRARASRTISARVDEDYSRPIDKLAAAPLALARGVSAGLSDAAIRAIGGEDAGYEASRLRESNPVTSTVFEVGGALLPVAPVSRLGSALSRAAPEAGALTKIGRSALGAGVEGSLQSVGQGISDLALDDDPVTLDRIAGSLSSRALYGGGTSAIGGAAIGGLEHVLSRSRRALAAAKAAEDAGEVATAIPDDIAALDGKGLRAAKQAELDAIEATRVPQRQALADDLAAFREQMKVEKPWDAVATGSKEAIDEAAKASRSAIKAARKAERQAADEIAAAIDGPLTAKAREARALADEASATYEDLVSIAKQKNPGWMSVGGARTYKPDRALDLLLDDPKALAGLAGTRAFESTVGAAQKALRKQEAALETIWSRKEELHTIHALDRTGRRAAALERIPAALERNRALQQRIDSLISAPASARLGAIEDAIASGPAKMTLKQKIGGALAFGAVTSAASGLDLPGSGMIAPILGAAAGSAVAGRLGGAVARATAVSRERQIKALDALMSGTRVVRKAAPVLSTQVLAATKFAPDDEPRRGDPPKKPALTLAGHFDARASEMARLVVPGPDGKPTVRPEVRQRIAEQLRPIAMTAPHLADRMETRAVKRVLYIDSKRPRVKQIGMTRIPPSEMEMRAWARVIAAADDPIGVVERVADGTVTPEDRETLRALYPDLMDDIVRGVVERLGELRGTLPYQKRLALSIFTGVPVDASTDPRILAQLQSTYTNEPDTEGGTRAPMPRPAFGSVKKPEPTPAQSRAG